MYAEPKEVRIEELMPRKDQIIKLLDYKWNDQSIANFLASDKRTIRRFRRAYNEFGDDFTTDQVLKFRN